MPHQPDPISLFLLISALVAACGFMGMYASNSPWRTLPVGRAMMLLAFSVALMTTSGIFLQVLGPDYPFRALFRIITYLVLNISLWWMLAILIGVQNDASKQADKPIVTGDEAEDTELVP